MGSMLGSFDSGDAPQLNSGRMLPVAISKDDAVVDFKNSRLANGLLTRALPDFQ